MASRLDELPVYQRLSDTLQPEYFNRARLGLRRLGNPLRLPLPQLRDLELVLDSNAWTCVDRSLNDVPVLAWLGFANRSGLHQPIDCELRYYHAHAALIRERVLIEMARVLDERLATGPATPPSKLAPKRG